MALSLPGMFGAGCCKICDLYINIRLPTTSETEIFALFFLITFPAQTAFNMLKMDSEHGLHRCALIP